MIDRDSPSVQGDRHGADYVRKEKHDGDDSPGGLIEAILEELGDCRETSFEENREENGAKIDERRDNRNGPGDWRKVALVDIGGHARNIRGAEVGQHQGPGDDPTIQAVSSEEIAFRGLEIVLPRAEIGDETNETGEK